ncbi:MAG: peptidyl-prolyl cis-trans isomerase cyclophilin type [Verrucomicrobiales bacterium]|nr:peptidyl-prolyl cis-trans isomerase cyclophilin type [Verrucomicrobiales bacterium]
MSRIWWLFLLLSTASIWAGPLAQFRTVYGDIDVELFDDKPVTTQNFVRYVQRGLYQDMFFHRHIPGFVIQGGGFAIRERGTTNAFVDSIPTFPAITNEFLAGRRISNIFGTIAMAKLGTDPDSATSQFFFNLANNAANLDTQNGGFTVFGKVVRGTNLLYRLNFPSAPTNHITIFNAGSPFDSIPSLSTNLLFTNLFFVDVSLLNTQVKLGANQTREINWNSVAGRTNYVEYTFLTNMPPQWVQLAATNGNGTPFKVVDAAPSTTNRFYRVRIDYPANPIP